MDTMLRGFWYLAVSARALRRGKTLPVTLLGEDLLLGRRTDGSVFAVGDACPHRGMPLRHGSFDGATLRCCYHGWAFRSADGCCTEIPSLAPDDTTDPGRFRLRTYPAQDVQGNVWVYVGAADADPGPVPTVPGFVGQAPQVTTTMRFPCEVDLAAWGFFDPGHPAFVHTSRWWKRNPAANLRLKEKVFEPEGMGFRMQRHHLKGGANPYALLGKNVRIDIGIQLPGVRIEHIEGDRHSACVLAAATPVSATETDVHYCVYWTPRWLAPLRPAATWMARDFLGQDRQVAERLMGNRSLPAPLFVGDPDVQVRWYMRLKKEYLAAREEGRAFVNPLRGQVLHWRS
ncbi:MAG: Rieske 2Fe-2S domain-containing protein [Gemmatimonadaceae bacterium]|nr:Rieske 2Fe-2S domain-containing protein [Acetobacteraceae bacterium]